MKIKKYWWVLILIIIYLLYNLLIKDLISDYQYKKNLERLKSLENQWISNSKKQLNTNQIYVLNSNQSIADESIVGLKIEKIIGDTLIVKKIKISNGFQNYYGAILLDYKRQKDTANSFTISKNVITSSNTSDYFPNLNFLKKEFKYKLVRIYEINVPFLSVGNTTIDNYREIKNRTGNIFLGNLGKRGQITSIINRKGNVKWIDKFPLSFGSDQNLSGTDINLHIKNYDIAKESVSDIFVSDSLGNKQIYNFQIKGFSTEINRTK